MVNVNKLKGRFVENGKSVADIAEDIGVDKATLYRKLNNPELISKVEKQMSGRERNIRIRKWETEGLRLFSERLQHVCSDACSLTFYYEYRARKPLPMKSVVG